MQGVFDASVIIIIPPLGCSLYCCLHQHLNGGTVQAQMLLMSMQYGSSMVAISSCSRFRELPRGTLHTRNSHHFSIPQRLGHSIQGRFTCPVALTLPQSREHAS